MKTLPLKVHVPVLYVYIIVLLLLADGGDYVFFICPSCTEMELSSIVGLVFLLHVVLKVDYFGKKIYLII